MKISKSNLLSKYGINLPEGKFSIYVNGDSYDVYSVKDDTEGCVLVGMSKGDDLITHSRDAFNVVFHKIDQCDDLITLQVI